METVDETTEKLPQLPLWQIIRRFLLMFVPLAILAGAVTTALYYAEARTEMAVLESNEFHVVELQNKTLAVDFSSVISDLVFLSRQRSLRQLLTRGAPGDQEALAEEWLSYCEQKGIYDQIRLLNETGMEVVRVNFSDGIAALVPSEQLAPKGDRYYFEETISLERDQVYVSPLDLNIERGEIERPLKPMIRFGTPVFDDKGQKGGIVVLNYLGKRLIDGFKTISVVPVGQSMLLDPEGFWLHGPKPEDEWGFMFEDRKEQTFANAFPEAWQVISGAESGRCRNADGMFTFTTLYPLLECQKSCTRRRVRTRDHHSDDRELKSYYWKIVSFVPADVLVAKPRRVLTRFLLLNSMFAILLGIGFWMLARAIVRRKLAKEMRERLISKLREALAKIKTLSGLVPICASCKKIRDDKGYWNRIEGYIEEHSEAEFSHGLCPDCEAKLYPEEDGEDDEE